MTLEMRGHIDVILDGVQISPRLLVDFIPRVSVFRLVHMPAQNDG
jgi:hypothetical protein